MLEVLVHLVARWLHLMLLVPRAACTRLPVLRSSLSAMYLYIFVQSTALLMILLTSALAALSVNGANVLFADDSARPVAGEGVPLPLAVRWLLRNAGRGLVHPLALGTLFALGSSLWAVMWEMYYDFPTLRRSLMGPPRSKDASVDTFAEKEAAMATVAVAAAKSAAAGERAVAAAVAMALEIQVEFPPVLNVDMDKCKEPCAGIVAPSTARLSLLSRTKSGSCRLTDPEAMRRERRRRIVLTAPLVVLSSAHLLVLVMEHVCTKHSQMCEGGSGLFMRTYRMNTVFRSALFAMQLQLLVSWVSVFPRWDVALVRPQRDQGALAFILAVALQLFLVPSLLLQGVLWLSGHHPNAWLMFGWSLWFLLATIVIVRPQYTPESGFDLTILTCDKSWVYSCFLFKLAGVGWWGLYFLRVCGTSGFAAAHKDMIAMALVYPMLWVIVAAITYLAVASNRLGRGFVGRLAAAGLMCILAGWSLVRSADLGCFKPALQSLVTLGLFLLCCRFLRKGALRREAEQTELEPRRRRPGPRRAQTMRFCLPVDGDTHERTLVGRTALLLAATAFTFCCSLVLCQVLAQREQRRGAASAASAQREDPAFWWHSAPGFLEVADGGAPSLRLGRAGDIAAAQDFEFATLGWDEQPRYGACGYDWHGLDLTDFAMLSLVGYYSPNSTDLAGLVRELLPESSATIKHSAWGRRRWLELEVETCSSRGRGRASLMCRNVTVVSVSGTDPTRVQDILENIRMWTEPVMMEIFSLVFPVVRFWSRDTMAMLIGGIHRVIKWLDLQDDKWHYSEILDRVRSIPPEREVVLTGHSLGGGIALVVGALSNRQAVAIQPPGLYHALAKHQEQLGTSGSGRDLHERSVSLVVESDLISHFDGHGGLKQTITCDQPSSGSALGCHSLEGTICHLLRRCGDRGGRWATCRHGFAAEEAARASR